MEKLLLQVENLRTYFFTRRGVAKAVDGISFHLKTNETLGLVGESGCGKTVTSLSILRLVPEPAGKIVGGRILFEGEDLLEKSDEEMRRIRGRKISMILQDPLTSLNPGYSVGSQVAEVVSLHQKVDKREAWERSIEALRLVGIPSPETRARDFPHQMSGGMRQRVSGAIAMSCRPSLLIADEPTTSLDVTIQAQYMELLESLQKQYGLGVIFITHDFGIVARMCDRVAVMYAGRIVETAGIMDLFENPQHPYTKALIACLPDIDGSVERLASIEGQPPDLAALSPGCNFYSRCAEKYTKCLTEYPPQVEISKDHYVSCWRSEE